MVSWLNVDIDGSFKLVEVSNCSCRFAASCNSVGVVMVSQCSLPTLFCIVMLGDGGAVSRNYCRKALERKGNIRLGGRR